MELYRDPSSFQCIWFLYFTKYLFPLGAEKGEIILKSLAMHETKDTKNACW